MAAVAAVLLVLLLGVSCPGAMWEREPERATVVAYCVYLCIYVCESMDEFMGGIDTCACMYEFVVGPPLQHI